VDRPKLRLSFTAIREAVRVGYHNPIALYLYMKKGLSASVISQLYDLMPSLGGDTWGLAGYVTSIKSDNAFNDYINTKLDKLNYGQVVAPELLYVLVRKFRPSVVVETGVSAGVSSAYILKALADNEHGKLYSIDYPNYAMNEGVMVSEDKETGFVVPDYLKDRWELHIGMSRWLLRPLLKQLGKIDFFLHDSEHSYSNMAYEYKVAWQYMKRGGLLLSHDIKDNTAFSEFARWQNRIGHEFYFTGMGVIQK